MKKDFLFGLIGLSYSLSMPLMAQQPDSAKVYQINEVVVSGIQARRETPVAFENIKVTKQNTGQSLPYLFSGSPSLTLTSDGGNGVGYASLRIRGTDASRINFTVDGVPLSDSESHGVFWVNMPDFASSLDHVQIQRGVGTSTNGAASFGATVSMQTQKPSMKPYAEAISSAGSFNTFTNTVKGGTGLIKDHFVFDARYSNVKTDGYIDRAKVDMDSYYASVAYYNAETMVKFQTFGSGEQSYQAWNGVSASMLKTNRKYNSCGEYTEDGVVKFYKNQTDNYWQHHYHLLATQQFNSKLGLSVTLHYTDGKGYYEDYKQDAKYAAYKLSNYVDPEGNQQDKTDLVRRKWLRNDFYGAVSRLTYRTAKLDVVWGTAINNYKGDHFGRVIWVKATNNLPKPDYEYYRNRGEKLDYTTYIKTNYNLFKGLNAYLDLQYRGIDYTIKGSDDVAGDNVSIHKTYYFFNPKAGISYKINKHNGYASFAVAHREPNRDNFTENGPSAQPTYETLRDLEIGYQFSSSFLQLGVGCYYMDYNNQLILSGKISEIGEALTSNIKDSYRMGIELNAGIQPIKSLRWSGNLSLSKNKIHKFTEFVDTYDADWNELPQTEKKLGTTNISFSPSMIANSLIDLNIRKISVQLQSNYTSRQYLDNTSSRERSIDSYFVNNLHLGYIYNPSFLKEIGLYISINNIFNEKYETNGWAWSYILNGERQQDVSYFAQAGTNIMARINLKF